MKRALYVREGQVSDEESERNDEEKGENAGGRRYVSVRPSEQKRRMHEIGAVGEEADASETRVGEEQETCAARRLVLKGEDERGGGESGHQSHHHRRVARWLGEEGGEHGDEN